MKTCGLFAGVIALVWTTVLAAQAGVLVAEVGLRALLLSAAGLFFSPAVSLTTLSFATPQHAATLQSTDTDADSAGRVRP